jgi:hypothetical protein
LSSTAHLFSPLSSNLLYPICVVVRFRLSCASILFRFYRICACSVFGYRPLALSLQLQIFTQDLSLPLSSAYKYLPKSSFCLRVLSCVSVFYLSLVSLYLQESLPPHTHLPTQDPSYIRDRVQKLPLLPYRHSACLQIKNKRLRISTHTLAHSRLSLFL